MDTSPRGPSRALLLGLGFAVLALAGCEKDSRPGNAFAINANDPTPASPTEPGATAPADDGISGTVVETMDGAGYTYARVDRGGTEIWVAGPETKLAVGTQLGAMEGTLMPNFHSDAFNRTFAEIYFVNAYVVTGAVPAVATPPPGDDISGTVVETMDAGGYTYARLDRNGTSLWVAGPTTRLAVGTSLGRMKGSLMTGFHSDTLDRTFDQIYFINAFDPTAVRSTTKAITPTPPPSEPAVAVDKVAPVAGGKSIAQVFADKDALAGKTVAVRGKVVKLNNGILDRNWIHLRDGTGAAGTDDLLITTQGTANLGDIVVARGTVATHKDFGANYKYDVVVEDATLGTK